MFRHGADRNPEGPDKIDKSDVKGFLTELNVCQKDRHAVSVLDEEPAVIVAGLMSCSPQHV